MAARLGNVLYWLGCIVAVGWVVVSHAEDDQFSLECVWTADRHHKTHCGGFPTRALCEREGRTAVASGELSSFNCVSAPRVEWESHTVAPAHSLGGGISGGIGIDVIALGEMFERIWAGVFRRIFDEPTPPALVGRTSRRSASRCRLEPRPPRHAYPLHRRRRRLLCLNSTEGPTFHRLIRPAITRRCREGSMGPGTSYPSRRQ